MCARHDITLGSYLCELEPHVAQKSGNLLFYLRLYSLDDGSPEWAGCLTLRPGTYWEADVEGGPPLEAQALDEAVESA